MIPVKRLPRLSEFAGWFERSGGAAVKRLPRLTEFTDWFERFSGAAAQASAGPYAFALALALVLAWLAFGPHFHWSDTYSLVINTLTTIVTFLQGFLILADNVRSERAIQLKLDAIIKYSETRNEYMAAEQLTAREIAERANRLHSDTA